VLRPCNGRAEAAGAQRGARLAERLAAAARAYERDRYSDVLRITKGLLEHVPESATARELHGLACYRLGRWREAIRHLEAARSRAGGDPSQLPVLMDCHRAQGHHRRVGELWEELRAASPDADVLAEGRLVLASDLADRGELEAAVDLLTRAGAARNLRHPAERHVRQWYVLADLLERAGDLPRARDLFSRVVEADPELADAGIRLAALGRRPRRRGQAAMGNGDGGGNSGNKRTAGRR
jgi:tetratricopeptide (TPR) repeat protein